MTLTHVSRTEGGREGERERERERDREKNNAGETNIDPDMLGRKGRKKLPRDFAAMFDITENPYLYIYNYTHIHTYLFTCPLSALLRCIGSSLDLPAGPSEASEQIKQQGFQGLNKQFKIHRLYIYIEVSSSSELLKPTHVIESLGIANVVHALWDM